MVACFPHASLSRPAATAADAVPQKRPVFVLARPTRASRAGERPQQLGRWFSTLNLRLPSGTAFRDIARWPAGAQTWTQTWTLPPYSSWSWIHIWIHIMNSYTISWSWIHMRHFMTYEFIYEFMYMKNIVKSYLKSCVPRFQMFKADSDSVTWMAMELYISRILQLSLSSHFADSREAVEVKNEF